MFRRCDCCGGVTIGASCSFCNTNTTPLQYGIAVTGFAAGTSGACGASFPCCGSNACTDMNGTYTTTQVGTGSNACLWTLSGTSGYCQPITTRVETSTGGLPPGSVNFRVAIVSLYNTIVGNENVIFNSAWKSFVYPFDCRFVDEVFNSFTSTNARAGCDISAVQAVVNAL